MCKKKKKDSSEHKAPANVGSRGNVGPHWIYCTQPLHCKRLVQRLEPMIIRSHDSNFTVASKLFLKIAINSKTPLVCPSIEKFLLFFSRISYFLYYALEDLFPCRQNLLNSFKLSFLYLLYKQINEIITFDVWGWFPWRAHPFNNLLHGNGSKKGMIISR